MLTWPSTPSKLKACSTSPGAKVTPPTSEPGCVPPPPTSSPVPSPGHHATTSPGRGVHSDGVHPGAWGVKKSSTPTPIIVDRNFFMVRVPLSWLRRRLTCLLAGIGPGGSPSPTCARDGHVAHAVAYQRADERHVGVPH